MSDEVGRKIPLRSWFQRPDWMQSGHIFTRAEYPGGRLVIILMVADRLSAITGCEPMNTLYEKLGGEAAVDAAVELFYKKVLADERIKRFFEGVDMKRQASHQKLFLTYAFGGMQSYPGRAMRAAHKRLVDEMGLSDEHFDAVIEDLGSCTQGTGSRGRTDRPGRDDRGDDA